MILACNHISKAFADETVLSDAVFHINEGERAAIVGINGAGKTTLLRIIVGELPADSGEIVTAKGSTIGYLPQQSRDITQTKQFMRNYWLSNRMSLKWMKKSVQWSSK